MARLAAIGQELMFGPSIGGGKQNFSGHVLHHRLVLSSARRSHE